MIALAIAFSTATAALAAEAGKKPESAKGATLSVNADDVKWSEGPPDLPKGVQIAVLHGDPTKKAVFTVRFKMPDGYKVPPHWHTRDEQLTILSGTFVVHMGDTMDAPPDTLTAGGFHYLPGKMHHAAEVTGETVLQVDGMGPFDIHYLNPADNPNPKGPNPKGPNPKAAGAAKK
jgi:quercetin dioxygenase-like cupin family protein